MWPFSLFKQNASSPRSVQAREFVRVGPKSQSLNGSLSVFFDALAKATFIFHSSSRAMADFGQQLISLLSALSSTDNEVRQTAETQLDDGLTKQPAELLSGLAHLVRVGADPEVSRFEQAAFIHPNAEWPGSGSDRIIWR